MLAEMFHEKNSIEYNSDLEVQFTPENYKTSQYSSQLTHNLNLCSCFGIFLLSYGWSRYWKEKCLSRISSFIQNKYINCVISCQIKYSWRSDYDQVYSKVPTQASWSVKMPASQDDHCSCWLSIHITLE